MGVNPSVIDPILAVGCPLLAANSLVACPQVLGDPGNYRCYLLSPLVCLPVTEEYTVRLLKRFRFRRQESWEENREERDDQISAVVTLVTKRRFDFDL